MDARPRRRPSRAGRHGRDDRRGVARSPILKLKTRADEAQGKSHLREAIRWRTRRICLKEDSTRTSEARSRDSANGLAAAYVNRGVVREKSGDLKGAVEDAGRAIDILERLQERLGEQWSSDLDIGLETAYSNCGVALGGAGDLAGAVEAHSRAIEIFSGARLRGGRQRVVAGPWQAAGDRLPKPRRDPAEDGRPCGSPRGPTSRHRLAGGLRDQLGEPWSLDFAEALASAYVTVAFIERHRRLGRSAERLRPLDRDPRAVSNPGEEWPPALAEGLANAYSNRATALVRTGDLGGAVAEYGRSIDIRYAAPRATARSGLRASPLGWHIPRKPRGRLGANWRWRDRPRAGQAWSVVTHWRLPSSGPAPAGNQEAVLEEYGRAIEIFEQLRERLGEQWRSDSADVLATNYVNRGGTLSHSGDFGGCPPRLWSRHRRPRECARATGRAVSPEHGP